LGLKRLAYLVRKREKGPQSNPLIDEARKYVLFTTHSDAGHIKEKQPMSVEKKDFVALIQRVGHIATTLDKLMDVLTKGSTMDQAQKTRIGQIRAGLKAPSQK
jgi:hypothetical protein